MKAIGAQLRARRGRGGRRLWSLALGLCLALAAIPVEAGQPTAAREGCQADRVVAVRCHGRACAVVVPLPRAASPTLTDGVAEVEISSAELPERLGDTAQEEFPWERTLISFEVNPDPPEAKLPANVRALLVSESKRPHVKHHIFPQEFKEFFGKKGINIHAFVMVLLLEDHLRIHRGAMGGPWNADWRVWIKANESTAKVEDIYRFAGEMIYRYCLMGTLTRYSCKISPMPPLPPANPPGNDEY